MFKYQLSINIGKSADKNSASTKAVKDCIQLFSSLGYKDCNIFLGESANPVVRYLLIFKTLSKFFAGLKKGALVGIQYPMLNNVFKYFIILARIKKVKFFCIIHDVESLRLGGNDSFIVGKEVKNLNYYDCLIVHNTSMMQWLQKNGVSAKMISLEVFDYLLQEIPSKNFGRSFSCSVVFAGNLAKSNFIYSLNKISDWTFNIYGPNYIAEKNRSENVKWKGEFSPDEVVYKLDGNFGLIWDGDAIDRCDDILGNYLLYNNPHKFSLYLAAGLPVIAPRVSAIGKMITDLNIGILIDSLEDLEKLKMTEDIYKTLQNNCLKIKKDIVKGSFFLKAVELAEKQLTA